MNCISWFMFNDGNDNMIIIYRRDETTEWQTGDHFRKITKRRRRKTNRNFSNRQLWSPKENSWRRLVFVVTLTMRRLLLLQLLLLPFFFLHVHCNSERNSMVPPSSSHVPSTWIWAALRVCLHKEKAPRSHSLLWTFIRYELNLREVEMLRNYYYFMISSLRNLLIHFNTLIQRLLSFYSF